MPRTMRKTRGRGRSRKTRKTFRKIKGRGYPSDYSEYYGVSPANHKTELENYERKATLNEFLTLSNHPLYTGDGSKSDIRKFFNEVDKKGGNILTNYYYQIVTKTK
jgi:hypothetical protein